MSEQTVEQQATPTKEQVIAFLQEQIEVKKMQVELQEINTRLATGRAEELKALGFIAQMTNPTPPADAIPHTITEKDMQDNPELTEQGFKVGDEVLVAKDETTSPKQRGLKKTK
jgi:hypothetical protein